ncbi:uncharacterized protein LOC123516841 [Portunus trituberculatus]|uniref:uncharacterized protein LOC123516841 n=1 Tax=Portunus trituberculatus TaxID=210409 RepID=UPI001E1CF852|nr:uncharacterized protein LOC123516841 [Portunus trituberculatus]
MQYFISKISDVVLPRRAHESGHIRSQDCYSYLKITVAAGRGALCCGGLDAAAEIRQCPSPPLAHESQGVISIRHLGQEKHQGPAGRTAITDQLRHNQRGGEGRRVLHHDHPALLVVSVATQPSEVTVQCMSTNICPQHI